MRNATTLLLILVALGFASAAQAQSVSTSAGHSYTTGTYTVVGYETLQGYNQPQQLRMKITLEFEDGDDADGYTSCPYWPQSSCSWSTDSGDVLAYNLQTSITVNYPNNITGRFLAWIDVYLNDSLYTTISTCFNWTTLQAC